MPAGTGRTSSVSRHVCRSTPRSTTSGAKFPLSSRPYRGALLPSSPDGSASLARLVLAEFLPKEASLSGPCRSRSTATQHVSRTRRQPLWRSFMRRNRWLGMTARIEWWYPCRNRGGFSAVVAEAGVLMRFAVGQIPGHAGWHLPPPTPLHVTVTYVVGRFRAARAIGWIGGTRGVMVAVRHDAGTRRSRAFVSSLVVE